MSDNMPRRGDQSQALLYSSGVVCSSNRPSDPGIFDGLPLDSRSVREKIASNGLVLTIKRLVPIQIFYNMVASSMTNGHSNGHSNGGVRSDTKTREAMARDELYSCNK